MSKKIAIICTSANMMGDVATGAWMEEVATPYYALKAAGHEVEIVSIQGGEIPIDQGSLAGDFNTDDCKKFAADEVAMKALKNSVKLDDAAAAAYDGIYLAGGHGTCVDFVDNALLTKTIETQFAAGKPVAADCHGPIALASCKKPDGTPLVAGKNVTCFTDTEEAAVGLTEKVPFLVEKKFREQGGNFSSADDWNPKACVDGNLVTGQNPQSSKVCVDAFTALFA
jgi:putative intracellular protease/amidase|tara:strand:+ start:6915 stop:7592 length:678 start_codon:yes stop_codon:yes gene_type:complete